MPSSTDAMVSLVVVTANMPSRKANAETELISNVNGSRMASPTRPDSPGTAPKSRPMKMPARR